MAKPARRNTSISSTSVNPGFFKVYIPNQSFKQLRIPPAFVKYLDNELYQNYTLVSPENSAWSVNLEEENDDLFFNKGWSDLVEEYSLELGDILLFTYLGAAQFSFKVFGQHCCSKNDPFMKMNNQKNDDPQVHKGKERQVKEVERREYVEVIDVEDEDSSESETELSNYGTHPQRARELVIDVEDEDSSESETELSNHGTHPQRAREFRQRKCKNSASEILSSEEDY